VGLAIGEAGLQLATKTDAYVTTLTTEWDVDAPYTGAVTSYGLGPDITVAGLSVGCIKLFDVRTSGGSVMDNGLQ
jgi:hypothetical protein